MKLKHFSKSSVLIAGPARNICDHISNDIRSLFNATSGFKETYGLVVESDSTDNTVLVLEDLKNTINNFDYISLGTLAKRMPKRTERLAYARNLILEQVKNNDRYKSIDYVIMADLDGINRDITKERIEKCWDSHVWDVVTANQPDAYYDVWTLRHPIWCPNDCFEELRKIENIIGKENAWNVLIKSRQISLNPSMGMIEVDSAFGGLGIYKKQVFICGKYEGLDSNGNEVSDHISFHNAIRKVGYRIFIDCGLVNSNYHLDNPSLPMKTRLRLGLIITQKIGVILFGKERFNKYLNSLLN